MIGHVAPEAIDGGPIAIVREGDPIAIDIEKRTIDIAIPAEEIAARLQQFKAPELKYKSGVYLKYCNSVSSASKGAVTC